MAKRLSVPKGTIANWVAAARHGRGPISGAKTAQELENEIARLRKELAEVKQEREVLKKKPPRTLPRNRSKIRVHEALVQGVKVFAIGLMTGCWRFRAADTTTGSVVDLRLDLARMSG